MATTAAAMAAGEITPSEAATVVSVLDVKRRALELVELEQRVAALEQRKGATCVNPERRTQDREHGVVHGPC